MKMDPNKRRNWISQRLNMSLIPLGGIITGGITQWEALMVAGPTVGTLGTGALVAAFASGFMYLASSPVHHVIMDREVTPRLPDGMDAESVRRVVVRLANATQHGLSAEDRHALARDMDMARDVLDHLCEEPVWLTAGKKGGSGGTMHLALRGDYLREKGSELADCVERRKGSDRETFLVLVGIVVPTMASIARDFAIDTTGFVMPSRPVPGQIVGEPAPVPELAAPALRLADEWLSGSRGSVPDLLAIAADTAARKDLDELQRTWKAARASAQDSEAVMRLDETFGLALSDISRTLSDAISARSAGDETDLRIQGRYIEMKHG